MLLKGDATFEPHDPREVDALDWLPLDKALERLSYEREQRVLWEATLSE
jgi:hypothetical protein